MTDITPPTDQLEQHGSTEQDTAVLCEETTTLTGIVVKSRNTPNVKNQFGSGFTGL